MRSEPHSSRSFRTLLLCRFYQFLPTSCTRDLYQCLVPKKQNQHRLNKTLLFKSIYIYKWHSLQKLAVQPTPSSRRSLRSFRNVPLVQMETSSSASEDSCDSFGSDGGFANTVNIKVTIIICLILIALKFKVCDTLLCL